uniref:Uncharacterized protein n=1 Tax=Oryza rufipogon TaxID=4529 RepID=A0A0E0NVL4_ORYRU
MWDLCCSCDPICKSQRVELIGIVTPNLLVSVQNWNRYHNRRPRGGCVPYSSFQATKCGTTRRR